MRGSQIVTTGSFVWRIGLGLIAGLVLAACSSSTTTEFDGTWVGGCNERFTIGAPEEDQPEGYVQGTLTIDSSTNTYSEVHQPYSDAECTSRDRDTRVWDVSGEVVFDGLSTTREGLEATVARYSPSGSSPATVGLLYREGDVLYRDVNLSSVIEDRVPDNVATKYPWTLDS